ncbi:MAG TPA: RsmE family RNA methyltransferase [Dehalococcoidia bacterium]
MNIILFEPAETSQPLPPNDRRARHVREVLRFGVGDTFDAGLIDGPRGKATIGETGAAGLRLEFAWGEEPPPLEPVTLIIGLPRPQTARKVLEEATALGVESMHFVLTERGEPGYVRSKLWTTGEWRRHLIEGASQAFTTRLPRVTWGRLLPESIAGLPANAARLGLDNYEGATRLGEAAVEAPVVLALGPERGWSDAERRLLRQHGFEMVHLGERVLRVETACVSAVAIVRAKMGRI